MRKRVIAITIAAGLLCALALPACSIEPGMNSNGEYSSRRHLMVDEQLRNRGIQNEEVLRAMGTVKRQEFVPEAFRPMAYDDTPLPIGKGQTISQPLVVAMMTEAVRPAPTHRVLEIGTGSGYQAAVLAEIVSEVYTIEIVPELARRAGETLSRLGYHSVRVREGDGFFGWPEAAPFDSIVVTAATDEIPEPLVEQLKVGGIMVLPLGPSSYQDLTVITKKEEGLEIKKLSEVLFVPMTGEAQKKGREPEE